ncbi:zinc finger, CCHC-type containing protein [Tanacetum coccineum]
MVVAAMSVVSVLTTPIHEDGENAIVEQIRKRDKMLNLPKNYRIPWRINIWLRMHQNSDKPKGNNVVGPSIVNMVKHNNSSTYNDNKGKRKHHDNTRANPNKKAKPTCWKCGKTGHIKRDCKGVNVGNKANGSGIKGLVDGSSNSLKGHNMFNKSLQVYYVTYVSEAYFMQDDDVTWWVKSGATTHVGKDRCWFKTYESLNDGSILHMRNESTTLVHGRDCVDLKFSSGKIVSLFNVLHVPNIRKHLVSSVVLEEVIEEVVQQPEAELRKSKTNRTPNNFRPEFQLYLIEGTREEDVAFWKEAINDEIDSIMGNNTWVFADLPPGCKPLSCKWIFKRKLKVDGTIEKFKARLVIQGFKQKLRIDYFDTYAPVEHFLNGELDEEVYMNQPQGFIMYGNENKVCKMIKLYELKQAPKQWHQKFDEVVLSNGYLLNQADKYVYSKFDESGKGVIICLYVDDMLIFGTDQVQVDLTKEFLSSRLSIKDMGEANVILGKRIKHESNGISISQSHYIKEVLKKFNYFKCIPDSTLMDTSEKLMPNNGKAVSKLEYSRVIGCLMYAITYTRPSIVFSMGKLSRLTYTGYPSVLKGYTNASWISNTKDNSSTTAGKEAEWLKNLLLEIPLWSKPRAPISIHCDSAATLANAYSQMYNRKSRHLGVRHNMICELITNGVISIKFVRSQQNLVDHLMKGLARDLVIKLSNYEQVLTKGDGNSRFPRLILCGTLVAVMQQVTLYRLNIVNDNIASAFMSTSKLNDSIL